MEILSAVPVFAEKLSSGFFAGSLDFRVKLISCPKHAEVFTPVYTCLSLYSYFGLQFIRSCTSST